MNENQAAAVIPIKTNNQRLPGKNTKALGDKPLMYHLFDRIKECNSLNEIFVDSSDSGILSIASSYGFTPIKRPVSLNSNETNGDHLIKFELDYVHYPIIGQFFVTQPFLNPETIDKAIAMLQNKTELDSVLGVFPIHNRFWFQKQPVNHDPKILVGTQHMEPIYCESGFYVFRRQAFLNEGTRVTKRHGFIEVDPVESVDIDTAMDFVHAEAVYRCKIEGSVISANVPQAAAAEAIQPDI